MVKIIENSKQTKVFKYKLLSQLNRGINNWNGQPFGNQQPLPDEIIWSCFYGKEELPDFGFKQSQKLEELDELVLNDVLQKYTQEYLGDDFIVDVSFVPPQEGFVCEMGIWLDQPRKKESVQSNIWRKATILLDELVETPYSNTQQRDIVLRKLGREYDSYPLDKKELSAGDFNDEEKKHIRIFEVLECLREEGLIWLFPPQFYNPLDDSLFKAWRVGFETTEKFIKVWEKKKKEWKETKEIIEKEKLKPSTFIKEGVGYFRFGEKEKPIKIGGEESNPFKLLQCLCSPFGAWKPKETIAEVLRENIRNTSGWSDPIGGKSAKIHSIQNAIKELQKIIGKREKIRYNWDNPRIKKNLRIEII